MLGRRVSIGFDLRVNPATIEGGLFEGQRLVPTIASPISADPLVWSEPDAIEEIWGGRVPNYGNPLGLAKSMDGLLEACHKQGISTSELIPVCITTAESNLIALNSRFGPGYFDSPASEDELLGNGWNFAGFDVLDLDGLISGLKGCGYKESTCSQLRDLFGSSLNELGLFLDWQIAAEYAEIQGLEIREHAPFVAVGVLTRAVL